MLDRHDVEIIRCLKQNARMQWKQIGEKVHMTGVAVANRIGRLERLGVIQGYTAKLNGSLIGDTLCSFVTVTIKEHRIHKFQAFVRERQEIKEAHRLSGELCFMLKVEVANQRELTELLDKLIVYGQCRTQISLDQIV